MLSLFYCPNIYICMSEYGNFIRRADLIKNLIERQQVDEMAKKPNRLILEANQKRWIQYQQLLTSELAAKIIAANGGGGNGGGKVLSGASVDADAQLFITNASITDSTQQTAVNNLVVALKGYNIWTKMKALYPFVGGTASQHKFNLKNPLDTNAAFRLVFNGGWTHSATGALPNGTNAWGNTFFYTTNWTTKDNAHLSYYSRTNIASAGAEIGLFNSAPDSSGYNTFLSARYAGDLFYSTLAISYNYGPLSVANTDGRGHFMANRTAANSQKGFKNGAFVSQNTTAAQDGGGTQPHALSAYNDGGNVNTFSPKECAFSSFGDGLTDTEAANYYTAVQAFQTTLSRNV